MNVKEYGQSDVRVQNFINEKRKSNEKFSYVNSIHDPINLQSEIHSTNQEMLRKQLSVNNQIIRNSSDAFYTSKNLDKKVNVKKNF